MEVAPITFYPLRTSEELLINIHRTLKGQYSIINIVLLY